MCSVEKITGFISYYNPTLLRSLSKSLTAPCALPPDLLIHCERFFRAEYQLNVKWMCACFQQADWPCSQAWVSLVHPADRHWLKCQGLAVCRVLSTGRGLSLRNVRTLNKQQHSSDILYPSVQSDTGRRFDWLLILTKQIFHWNRSLDLVFLLIV